MNEQELITAAKGRLHELDQQDRDWRLRLEELEIEAAERQGRLQVLQLDYAERLAAVKRDCEQRVRGVAEDSESIARERQVLLAKRRGAKRDYGILFEQVGRVERALEAAEAERALKAAETEQTEGEGKLSAA